jgi:F0F1-type ATP synthase assembly protein I
MTADIGPDVDLSTQPKRPERSLGDLFSEMTSELSTLFRQEIELAKTETREEAAKVGKASAMLGAAAIGALLALVFVSAALAWLLDHWMDVALAFLIVGLIWAIAAGVLVTAGRSRLKAVQPLPETARSIKEDVEWAKAQRS